MSGWPLDGDFEVGEDLRVGAARSSSTMRAVRSDRESVSGGLTAVDVQASVLAVVQ